MKKSEICIRCLFTVILPSEPATFVQGLPNVFQTPWTFATRWVVVVQTSLIHWVGSCKFFQVLADISFSFLDADCEIVVIRRFGDLIHTLIHTFFASSLLKHTLSCHQNSLSSTSVCTIDSVCDLFRLKSFSQKRYLMGIPL